MNDLTLDVPTKPGLYVVHIGEPPIDALPFFIRVFIKHDELMCICDGCLPHSLADFHKINKSLGLVWYSKVNIIYNRGNYDNSIGGQSKKW